MIRLRKIPIRGLLFSGLVAFLAACQDAEQTSDSVTGPSLDISDGTSGGNAFFFFQPPLSSGGEFGGFNATLRPFVKICELLVDETTTPPTVTNPCVADVTHNGTFGVGDPSDGLQMELLLDQQIYKVNWDPDVSTILADKFYRIEVWALPVPDRLDPDEVTAEFIEDFRFGFRDVDPDDGPPVASCDGSTLFCKFNVKATLPIKVRIEDFALCPVTRSCASQFVAEGEDANIVLPSNNGLTIPGQDDTDFFLTLDECSEAEDDAVDAAIALPTFGPCFKTETNLEPGFRLATPAVVSICEALSDVDAGSLANPTVQRGLVGLHHFSDDLTTVTALPHANLCPLPAAPPPPPEDGGGGGGGVASASTNPITRFARAVRDGILGVAAPEPLMARMRRINRGGGGDTDDLESFFKLALPAKFEYVNAADAVQVKPVATDVTLTAKVTDLFGGPVLNAKVSWRLMNSPNDGGSLGVLTDDVLTNAQGLATVILHVAPDPGDNDVEAFGRGIADDRDDFNGPRDGMYDFGPFDPFEPIEWDEKDGDGIDDQSDEQSVDIVENTLLPFTVTGCVQGFGTPNRDGVIDPGEWECAEQATFPVNLSGGSTDATLFWMNDDTDFHLAVVVPGTGRQNGLRIDWDNDGDGIPGGANEGAREPGDDVWEFDPDGGPADKFIDEKCSESSQSGCGKDDDAFDGAMDTRAAFNNTLGGTTVYEMSHPLATGDLCSIGGRKGCGVLFEQGIDLDAFAGDLKGFFLTLRLGSGAQGNTQWPGFLQYLMIEIR